MISVEKHNFLISFFSYFSANDVTYLNFSRVKLYAFNQVLNIIHEEEIVYHNVVNNLPPGSEHRTDNIQ